MADTFYAWSPILYGADFDDKGNKLGDLRKEYGDTVSAADLNLDDRQFQQLVDSGAVKNFAPPQLPAGYTGSPRDYALRMAQMAEGALAGGYFAPEPILQTQQYVENYELNQEAAKAAEAAEEGKVVDVKTGEAKPVGSR